MSKWLKNILAIIILGFLLLYLSKHWQRLGLLLKLRPTELLVLYALCLLLSLSSACVVQCLLNALKTRTSFWDLVRLHNATTLLNYVPMKFGTLFRANYLKRHYGLSYAHFGTFFVYMTLLMTATASIVGLVVLVAVYGVTGYERKVLAAAFLVLLAFSIFFAFVPLPIPTGSGKLSTVVRNFFAGRHQVTHSKRTLFICTAFLAGNFILSSVRLGIIYNSMGQNVHPAGYLVFGALGFVTTFMSLTPGSLGVRELILGSAAVALGIPLEVGVLAAMVDRAITLSWVFVVGGACTGWLWHKSPADFKKGNANLRA